MIDAKLLKDDLVAELKLLERDLRSRIDELPDLKASLEAEWSSARNANRTAEPFVTWVDQVITQAGVHWLLACVFLRFIEDNQLIERPWLGGTPSSGRLALARDRYDSYFRDHPHESDREYLLAAFRDSAKLPGLGSFFDEAHNPLFRLAVSGDAAMRLRSFWARTEGATGLLRHDFTDPDWNTRFLGDLYQDLSEATRKRYALLQTPEFVEEFILDRTLTPAIAEFGFREARLIDPTCGSGHFLLGAFYRLVAEWQRHEPGLNPRAIAQNALDNVAGVDLNPFAVAIARFRLMVAALRVAGTERLSHAPNFKLNVAIGDSLLHGSRFGGTQTEGMFEDRESFAGTGLEHAYATEDLADVRRILGRQYHAVVGNPPYITADDAKLNAAYRERYESCAGQFSLGVPFTERFFEIAIQQQGQNSRGGFIGLITTNSFMKREFGPKLISKVLPKFELTHILDTSGAYIPGHGTPTVIILGRNRAPILSTVRTVLGIAGEPSVPENPANGLVWTSILDAIDRPNFESRYVSSADFPISKFRRHPWRIGGGGAAELSDYLDQIAPLRFPSGSVVAGTGRTSADDAFLLPAHLAEKGQLDSSSLKALVDEAKDWILHCDGFIFAPYAPNGLSPPSDLKRSLKFLWSTRTVLESRVTFGKNTYRDEERAWWSWHQITLDRLTYRYFLAFDEITTHNHFALDRGGKVFKQTTPLVKLPTDTTEEVPLGLLGLMNSSVACFWLKQVCFPKGGDHMGNEGARVRKTLWDERYAFNATNVAEFPLAKDRPLALARQLDQLATRIAEALPAARLSGPASNGSAGVASASLPTREMLDAAREQVAGLRRQSVAWQEELDWQVYALYCLLTDDVATGTRLPDGVEPPEVNLGERAFEIVLARRMAAGTEQTIWFERHGSTPITEIPAHWPAAYRDAVQRRIDLIERDRSIGLIERPEYKRRWNTPDWDGLERAALRSALLDRLDAPVLWPATASQPPQLTTTAKLADRLMQDTAFLNLAALYTGRTDADLGALVAELVASESVPFLPVLRYTESGLRKRAQWENTWTLQRHEDAIDAEVDKEAEVRREELMTTARAVAGSAEPVADALKWVADKLHQEFGTIRKDRKAREVGPIPAPPKYKKEDFKQGRSWDLRGGLDVPKERWISYPDCERGADPSLPIAWAGWHHLQQATALATYLLDMKDNEGWPRERLLPLLAGLLELVPWLKQWHNDLDPAFGERMGHYYEGFVTDQTRELGYTLTDLRAWKPAPTTARRGRKAKS